MKRFILSDLHIGHKNAQYDVMDQVISYIQHEASAGDILIPGNHDHALEKYRDNSGMGNPVSPIKLIKPFMNGRIWYCHGHEYDPSVEYVPARLIWLWNHLPQKKLTPGNLRMNFINERYIMLVYLVHSRALLNLQQKVKKEHQECKRIVLGHTHLPLHQVSPELMFLLNDGDMRHSATFTIEDENEFRHMTWHSGQHQWRIIPIPKP